jgi:hypothetical protein
MFLGEKFPLRDFAKGGVVNYKSTARAIIKPPEYFGLPEFMIEVVSDRARATMNKWLFHFSFWD